MHIGVIGAGTSSAVAILAIADRWLSDKSFFQSFHVTCVNDPSIPVVQVGESLSPSVIAILHNVLGLEFLEALPNFDGTPRYFSKYFLSEQGDKNFHTWHQKPGSHVNSQKFSRYVINAIKQKHSFLTEINDTVDLITYNDNNAVVNCKNDIYKFDFVIDCTGSPTTEEIHSEEYNTDVFESMNSVIIFPEFKTYEEPFTSVHFHKHGWMFGVPLTFRKAWGYLYNNNITSYKEACSSFEEIKTVDTASLRNISWQPYYKKKAITGRILSLGNRLYFFEPQHAIPLHYYLNLTAQFLHEMLHLTVEQLNVKLNNFHKQQMEQVQNIIALNYIRDPKYNTDFWRHIRPKAMQQLKNSKDFQLWLNKCLTYNTFFDYFTHDSFIMKYYIEGYSIDLDELKNNEINFILT